MKRITVGIISVFCAWHVYAEDKNTAEELPTVMEVRKALMEVNGGMANIQSIQSMIISGQILTIDERKLDFKLYRKRPNLMRMRVDTEKFSVDTLYDGKEAYRRTIVNGGKGEYEILDSAETKSVAMGSHLESPFILLSSQPGILSLVGQENVRDVECYRFDVSEDSDVIYGSIWVSIEDSQELKYTLKASNGPDKSSAISIYFSDFRQHEGLWIAGTTEYWSEEEKFQTIHIDEVRMNAGIFDSFFQVDQKKTAHSGGL